MPVIKRVSLCVISTLFLSLAPAFVQAQERIISLKPNITEILYELGVGDKLVGVTTYCDNPAAAKLLPKVADYIHADVEKILSLKPDLVFDSEENNVKTEIEFLKSRKIPVEVVSFRRLNDFISSILTISKRVNREKEGEAIVARLKEGLSGLKQSLSAQAKQEKIILIVGIHPLVVVGSQNFLDDILEELSLTQVARTAPMRYPTFTTEELIYRQPTVIFDLSMGTETRNAKSALKWYEQYKSIPAVQNKKVFFMNMDDFRPSSHILEGLKKMVEHLNE